MTEKTDAEIAFAKEMEGRQYGEEETSDAFHWFMAGWEARDGISVRGEMVSVTEFTPPQFPGGKDARCCDCDYSGMDMDMDPYCAHPEVIKHAPFGSSTNVVRGARYAQGRSPAFNVCGEDAKLFEPRKAR